MKLCWFHQKIISSRLSDGSPLPGRVERHLQSCARCRQVAESAMATIRVLSSDLPGKNPAPPPFLHARIMSAIRAEQAQPQKLRPAFGPWIFTAVAATACVVFAGLFWQRPPVASVQNVPAPRHPPAELALNVKLPSAAQMNQWSAALDKPLEVETQLVLNDAKTALDSLRNSFLPGLDKGSRDGGN